MPRILTRSLIIILFCVSFYPLHSRAQNKSDSTDSISERNHCQEEPRSMQLLGVRESLEKKLKEIIDYAEKQVIYEGLPDANSSSDSKHVNNLAKKIISFRKMVKGSNYFDHDEVLKELANSLGTLIHSRQTSANLCNSYSETIMKLKIQYASLNTQNNKQAFTFNPVEPANTGRSLDRYYDDNERFLNLHQFSFNLSASANSGEKNIITGSGKAELTMLLLRKLEVYGSYNTDVTKSGDEDIQLTTSANIRLRIGLDECKDSKSISRYILFDFNKAKDTNQRIRVFNRVGLGMGFFVPYDDNLSFDVYGMATWNDDELNRDYVLGELKPEQLNNEYSIPGNLDIFDSSINSAPYGQYGAVAGIRTRFVFGSTVVLNNTIEIYKPSFGDDSDGDANGQIFYTWYSINELPLGKLGNYNLSLTASLTYTHDNMNKKLKTFETLPGSEYDYYAEIDTATMSYVLKEQSDLNYKFVIGLKFTYSR